MGGIGINIGSTILVDDGHDAVDGSATKGMLYVAVIALNEDVHHLVLTIHRWLPRL